MTGVARASFKKRARSFLLIMGRRGLFQRTPHYTLLVEEAHSGGYIIRRLNNILRLFEYFYGGVVRMWFCIEHLLAVSTRLAVWCSPASPPGGGEAGLLKNGLRQNAFPCCASDEALLHRGRGFVAHSISNAWNLDSCNHQPLHKILRRANYNHEIHPLKRSGKIIFRREIGASRFNTRKWVNTGIPFSCGSCISWFTQYELS